jgi:hypothetical protein
MISVWLRSGTGSEAVSVTDTNNDKIKKYIRAIYIQDTSSSATRFTRDVVVSKVDQATGKAIVIARFNFSALNSYTGSLVWNEGERHMVAPGDKVKIAGDAGDTHAGYLVRIEYTTED